MRLQDPQNRNIQLEWGCPRAHNVASLGGGFKPKQKVPVNVWHQVAVATVSKH